MRVEARVQVFVVAVQIGAPLFGASAWAAGQEATATAPAEDIVPEVPRSFGLNVTDLYLGMELEYEQRKVRYEGERRRDYSQTDRDFRLYELLGTTLAGYVYDPNLLEYRAALEFGLSQARFEQKLDGTGYHTDSDDGFLHRYDVSVDILKTKPVSFNVYARRSDNRLPRSFLPSLHELLTETGVTSFITAGPTTTEIGLSWQDATYRGNRDRADNEDLEVGRFYLDHTWNISDNQKLRIQYDHNREESKYQGSTYSFDSRWDELRLEHELAFGSSNQHRLDTFFRYNDERGDLARTELEFVPRLTLTHSDQLKTMYRYSLDRYRQGELDITQNRFDFQAVYRPREDLRITLDAYGLYEEEELDVDTNEFGGSFDVNYNRTTSTGTINLNFASGVERMEVNGDGGRRYVRAEAHALGGVRPVLLAQQGVVPGSVIAHDERRRRYYVPGVDYLLVPLGGRTLVERVPTGRIAEDQVVYFDYQYVVPADATLTNYRNDLLLEYTFNFGLTPYYSLQSQCENVQAGEATLWEEEDSHRHRLGVRYDRPRWSVGTEFEIFDDSVIPYDAWHLTGRQSVFRSAAHSLDLSGELSRYWFKDDSDDSRVWWLDLDLKDQMRVNQSLSLTNALAYRWQDDSVDGTTNGVDLTCGFQYVRGALTIELTVEYDLLSIAEDREDGFGVYLNVRRDLSYLLKDKGGVQ
jgi:hypothetical protein